MPHAVRPTGTPGSTCPNRPRPDSVLRSLARRIRRHPRTTAGQVVALGRLLILAKGLVGANRFADWLERAMGKSYGLRTAREAMTAARRLPALGIPLGRFSVSAVRVLVQPDVARSPALVSVLAELGARRGPVVTFSEARAAVSAVSPATIYPRAGARTDRETPAEALARHMSDLVYNERVGGLYIGLDHDGPSVMVTVMGDRPRTVTRELLTSALAAAVGEEKLRRCPHPEHKGENPLPPDAFNRQAHYCKMCDRRRVSEWAARKKKKAGAAVTRPAGERPGGESDPHPG